MTANQIVQHLLEYEYSPYDVDDPLEKRSEEEQAAQERAEAEQEFYGLLDRQEQAEKVAKAAAAYLYRQRRKSHPSGKFDSAGRWYPGESEKQPCCAFIRSPTRSFPYSLMTHCRTKEHVANLYGVSLAALKQALK